MNDSLIITYDNAKNIIRKDLESMSKKFITIGYYLKYIRDNEMYKQDNFSDIWEFAKNTYGISKSTYVGGVACGAIIPEEQQVCWQCQKGGTMNQEGYKDPTAERAVHNAGKMPRNIRKVVQTMNELARIHGIEIVKVRDTRTKQEWEI